MTIGYSGKPESRVDRILRRVVWILALAPTASLALFYSLVLRARVVLGHWPSYGGDPDPTAIGSIHHLVVFYSTLAAILSIPLFLPVAAVAWFRRPKMGWQIGVAFLLCVGVLVGSAYLHRLDPWGITEWFAD